MLRSSTLNNNKKNQLPSNPAVNIEPNEHGNPYETIRNQPTERTVFPGPTPPQQPQGTHISPAPEREGEGRARPEDVPPHGFLGPAAGGESALPASPRPYRPGLGQHHHRPLSGENRRGSAPHPCLPASRSGARSSGQMPRGHRAAPRTPEQRQAASPPPPLRSATSRRRPRANFAGGRGSDQRLASRADRPR